jgi:hypothetical protein
MIDEGMNKNSNSSPLLTIYEVPSLWNRQKVPKTAEEGLGFSYTRLKSVPVFLLEKFVKHMATSSGAETASSSIWFHIPILALTKRGPYRYRYKTVITSLQAYTVSKLAVLFSFMQTFFDPERV